MFRLQLLINFGTKYIEDLQKETSLLPFDVDEVNANCNCNRAIV